MAVGEVDIDALLERISSRQLVEWMAYYAIEPFGEERSDLRMAMLASVIANANRDPKQRREPFTAADFMPKFDPLPESYPDGEREQRQTWEQQKAIIQALTMRRGQTRRSAPTRSTGPTGEDKG